MRRGRRPRAVRDGASWHLVVALRTLPPKPTGPGKIGTSRTSTCCAVPLLEDDMNNKFFFLRTAASLPAGPSFAQKPPAADRPNNNAVNSSGQNNSSKAVAGANSCPEAQAKSKIEDARHTN